MRYTPVAVALSLAIAMTSSVSLSVPPETLDPRVVSLLDQGRAAEAAGDHDGAVSAYEAALTVQPGSATVLVALAGATRETGMTGKALHYYRDALARDPRNLAAISGEGVTLAEKGATDKARASLARLENLCGKDCAGTREVTAAIARGATAPKMAVDAGAVSRPAVTDN